MNKERALFRNIALGVILLWLTFMIVIPNALVVVASFLSFDAKDFVKLPFTFDNYFNLLDPILFKLIVKSIRIAIGSTICCLLIAYPFAYIIATAPKKARPLLLLFIIIPFWTNSLIRNYSLIALLSSGGVLNRVLTAVGLIDEPLQILYTSTAVFIGMTYTLLPFMILPLYSSLEKMDFKLVEAGRDLGANVMQILVKIILPQTAPGIIAGIILVFLPALSMFYISDLLGGADVMVVGNIIRNKFLTARDWPTGSAVSMLLTALMALMFLFYSRAAKSQAGLSRSRMGDFQQ